MDKLEAIVQSAKLGELHLIAKIILQAGVSGRVVVDITAQRDDDDKSRQYTYKIVRRGT